MRRPLPPLLPLVVGVLSLAVTLGLWLHERHSERARLRAIFDFNLRQTVARIEQRVANYEQMLRGAQGLFATKAEIDRTLFEGYVDVVMSGPDAAGLQGFAYEPLVSAERLPAHVAARVADGFAGYAVRPPGERAAYAPITYVAPASPSNRGLYGFDLLADPARRMAMMQALDSGHLAISRNVRPTPARPDDPQDGMLMFLPLYASGAPPAALARRRAQAIGWVTASFRIGDLMATLYGEASPGLALRLHDGADATDASLMYRSGPAGAHPRFEAQEYIAFAGHAWTLRMSSLPEFERVQGRDSATVILVAGLVLSVMLALLTHQLGTARTRAAAAARAMTQELRESELRYRRIVETADEGIWLLDARQRIVFVNPRLAQWLGADDATLLGRPLEDVMSPDDAARCRAAAIAPVGADRPQPIELALRRADGGTTWVSLAMQPVADDAGRATGALGMLTDIGERRHAEERRAALEAQLRDSQKMEAIGTLAGGIAHDFNNILAAILGNVAAARDAGLTRAERDAGLAQVERAAVRARSLVQQILTFSRMQAQALHAQALRPVIEETLEMLRAAMPPAVTLAVDLSDAPVYVRADATQIEQVVMNLVTNAWHALRDGRGRIEVGLRIEPVDQHPQADDKRRPPPEGVESPGRAGSTQEAAGAGPRARLWVADDGCGMDEATRARVFEPFFTTKQVGHGTGLGLAVVHGIVSVHGGTIRVESAPGAGSRFDVWFPLLPAPAPAAVPESAPAAGAEAAARAPVPRGSGQRIACVDDDPAMVLMMEGLLRRHGYAVTTFEHAADALAAASADPPAFDLVVSDYNMPGMNGMALAQALALAAPALPVIITSGFISDEMRQQAAALRIGALLQKEYTLERLAGLVHEVLVRRGMDAPG